MSETPRVQTMSFSSAADDGEELARAEVYGLLANLLHAPPDESVYVALQVAVTEAPSRGAFLERSWSELVEASRRLTLAHVSDEYATLFLGVGRPDVYLYGSFFLVGSMNGKPLVDLRRDLNALGLERPETISETEDHIACLCEVMRYLIAGDDVGICNLGNQQRFFNAHLRGWVEALCDATAAHARADFYRAVAGFARDFFSVETEAFDLVDA